MTADSASASWSAREALLAAAPAVVIATVFLVRGLLDGPTLDGAVFALIGDAVAHGGMPYRDVWDHKPPGVYIVNGLIGLALPEVGAWPRAWLVSWLSTIGALLGLSILLARSGQRWPGIVAATLIALPLFAAHQFVLGGGQTESVGLLFAVAGVGLAASDRRALVSVGAGAILGTAVLVSVQFVPALVAAAVVVALAPPGRIRRVAGLVLGSLVVPTVALVWIVANGSLSDMIEQVIAYNRIYLASNQQYRVSTLLSASGAVLFVLPLIVAALARMLALRRGGATRLEIAAVVWMIVGVCFIAIQGLYFDHYVTALAPPLVILAAPSLGSALAAAWASRHPAISTTLLIVALGAPAVVGTALTEARSGPATTFTAVAARIHELTAPGDPIFVWGNEAALYLAADRPLGSRFVYMFPLTAPGYATPELMAQILQAWETRPPRMVIDATSNPGRVGGYPLTLSTESSQPDAVLDPLRTFIQSHYRILTSVSGWDLYVEESPPP